MNISNSMNVAIQEIHSHLKKEQPIRERFKEAAKIAVDHWLITDEDERFRCAVGAVMLDATPEERLIINDEMASLRAMSAMMSGVPVDLEALFGSDPMERIDKFYGLLAIWKEVRNADNA